MNDINGIDWEQRQTDSEYERGVEDGKITAKEKSKQAGFKSGVKVRG